MSFFNNNNRERKVHTNIDPLYEVWLLNNETARLEGALEGWGNKRVVRRIAANLLYSRTKTRFRHYFSMCAAAV